MTFFTPLSRLRRSATADYTFTTGDGGDNGVHSLPGGVTLVTVGDQILTSTDTVSGITGNATVTVGPGP